MGDDFLRTLQVFGIELKSNLEIDQQKKRRRGLSQTTLGLLYGVSRCWNTQWKVTGGSVEMVPTTNRASDLLDGVDDIKRRLTKFREVTTLGILESILSKSAWRRAGFGKPVDFKCT